MEKKKLNFAVLSEKEASYVRGGDGDDPIPGEPGHDPNCW